MFLHNRNYIVSYSKKCFQSIYYDCGRYMSSKPKTAVVMLNMGGPQSLDEVNSFLHNIMTDRDIMQLPIQNLLGPWIANRRTASVRQKYNEIGGCSPIFKWTQKQGDLLCKQLDTVSPATAPHKYYIAFRYCKPLTEDAFIELENDGVNRAVLFSQYPQYSCSTSGSSYNAIYQFYKNRKFPENLKLSVIDRWPTHPLLIKTFADLIRKELDLLPDKVHQKTVILFSAHSLPLDVVNRGDSYPAEVGATVQLVMEELNFCNPYQLVWQSKVGPLPWLGPFTEDALEAYVKKGIKNFILVPIAFVNEHIETLHELDIEYCNDLGKKLKVDNIRRVPTPNDHPLFIDALTDIVKTHLEKGPLINSKFLNTCPHCNNENCRLTKKWLSDICNK